MQRWIVPGGVFALLITSACGDHYFLDGFYYITCSHRLDWGFVDHPPGCVALLWLVRHLAGDSLMAIRAAAAGVAAATVWLTGAIARRFGAGAFGETLAMTAADDRHARMTGLSLHYLLSPVDSVQAGIARRAVTHAGRPSPMVGQHTEHVARGLTFAPTGCSPLTSTLR